MNTTSNENITSMATARSAVLIPFETRRSHGHTQHVASGGAWLKKYKSTMSENFLDDMHYCAEWVECNYVPVRDPNGKILFLLTRETVHRDISKAVAILKANGVDTNMIWLLDDVISPANFGVIAACGDYEFVRTMVQIAVDWMQAPEEVIANFEEVIRQTIFN